MSSSIAYVLMFIPTDNDGGGHFAARGTHITDTSCVYVSRGEYNVHAGAWVGDAHRCVASDAHSIARLWNRTNTEPLAYVVTEYDPTVAPIVIELKYNRHDRSHHWHCEGCGDSLSTFATHRVAMVRAMQHGKYRHGDRYTLDY